MSIFFHQIKLVHSIDCQWKFIPKRSFGRSDVLLSILQSMKNTELIEYKLWIARRYYCNIKGTKNEKKRLIMKTAIFNHCWNALKTGVTPVLNFSNLCRCCTSWFQTSKIVTEGEWMRFLGLRNRYQIWSSKWPLKPTSTRLKCNYLNPIKTRAKQRSITAQAPQTSFLFRIQFIALNFTHLPVNVIIEYCTPSVRSNCLVKWKNI